MSRGNYQRVERIDRGLNSPGFNRRIVKTVHVSPDIQKARQTCTGRTELTCLCERGMLVRFVQRSSRRLCARPRSYSCHARCAYGSGSARHCSYVAPVVVSCLAIRADCLRSGSSSRAAASCLVIRARSLDSPPTQTRRSSRRSSWSSRRGVAPV